MHEEPGVVNVRNCIFFGNTTNGKGDTPAIDTGDPAVKCVEPRPNGWRVNMGAYGNTPWATMSKQGTALIVR